MSPDDEEVLLSPSFIPIASDIPDLGKAPETLAEFGEWCRRQRESLRQWRVRFLSGHDPQTAAAELAAQREERTIREMHRQCKVHLRHFGAKNIPEEFLLAWLPVGKKPREWKSACRCA